MKKKLFLCVFLLLTTVMCLTVSASALTQLAAPTELEWGREYYWDATSPNDYRSIPGAVSFKVNYPCQNKFYISLYRVGENEPVLEYSMNYGSDRVLGYCVSDIFLSGHWDSNRSGDPNLPSGTYYFTISAEGDGVTYSDSVTATSRTWTYTAPAAKLPTITNLRWDGRTMCWDDISDHPQFGGYSTDILFQPSGSSDIFSCGGSSGFWENEEYLEDWALQDNGEGTYYFRVRGLSDDPNVTTGGYWSALSPGYNLSGVVDSVDSTLDEMLNTFNSWTNDETGLLDENGADYMKGDLWNLTDTEELSASMAADTNDSGTNALIQDLEALVGGPAEVNVAEDAPEGLDAGGISIVGANLNTSGTNAATLNVGKADEGVVIDEQYANAVQFSMKLDGVESDPVTESQELKIPVKITMPVPTSINPEFLVLLHFHADGTYEEIMFPHVFTEGGVTYVSFIVTSFSDFALCQWDPAPLGVEDMTGESVDIVVNSEIDATCMAALYANGKMLEVVSVDVEAGPREVTVPLNHLGYADELILFLVDENSNPLIESYIKTL